MNFQVYDKGESIKYCSDTLYLRRDNWDDYSFRTTFDASYCESIGNVILIGQVKIGVIGMEPAVTFDIIPKHFSKLDNTYFSLGQDERPPLKTTPKRAEDREIRPKK